MTPVERERIKAAMHAYQDRHRLTVHDLAARMNASRKRVDAKLLHRYLDRRLEVDDSTLAIYRDFLDLLSGQDPVAGP